VTSANTINRLTDVAINANTISHTVPAQSVTLFVVQAAVTAPRLRIGTNSPSGQIELWIDGQTGQHCVLQSSINLTAWLPVSTNQMASNSLRLLVPFTSASQTFYRAATRLP
jgi:hypothetical protein